MKKEKDVVNLLEKWLAFDPDFADLVLAVIQGLKQRISEIEKSLEDGNAQLIKDQVHSLKGVTGNFHMTELYTLFLDLDIYLKGNMIIDENVKAYVRQIKEFVELIPNSYDQRVILPPKLDEDEKIELSILIGGQMKDVTDILIQMSYEHELSMEGAANGLEVLEKFYMEPYDLVILKENMDMLSGLEVSREIEKSQNTNLLEIWVVKEDQEEIETLRRKVTELIKKKGVLIEEVLS